MFFCRKKKIFNIRNENKIKNTLDIYYLENNTEGRRNWYLRWKSEPYNTVKSNLD